MRIAGVKFEKDAKGKNRYVRIDLRKHGEAITPLLEKLGTLNGNVEEDAAYRAEFEKKWATGITGKELMKGVIAHINTLPWKK